jgi:DNA modification methylase
MVAPKIEIIRTDKLIPYARNARTHSDEQVSQIAGSIKEFGFTNPVLIDSDNGIIAGHGRVMAARVVGLAEVPCLRLAHLSETQRRAYILADNRIALNSGWDESMLALEIMDLQTEDFDIESLGFDSEEIRKLIAEAENLPTEGLTDPEDIPAEIETPVSKLGDIWILGNHRLVCGSCLDFDTVKNAVNGMKINVAFTSPPYASQRKYDESSGFKPINPDDYVEWFEDVQANIRAFLASDGSWFVNIKEHASDGCRHLYVKDLTLAHVRKWGWMLRDELVWNKTGVPGIWPDRFRNDWEPIFHFSAEQRIKFRPESVLHESKLMKKYNKSNSSSTFGGNIGVGAKHVDGMARPGNVLKISTRENISENNHSAAFPVSLPEHFIKAFSDTGDVVCDPFSGSGTTIMASEMTGRKCIAIEISPAYVDMTIKRWQEFTGKVATLENSGETFTELLNGQIGKE